MNYWLVKTEPGEYSWDDLVKLERDHWDGVRNYQARNNLKNMKVNDQVLFYHSVNEKQIVGIAKVVKEFYQDPTTEDDRWVVVDIVPLRKLNRPVTLQEIKEDSRLDQIPLIRNSRLSVMPIEKSYFDIILDKSEQK